MTGIALFIAEPTGTCQLALRRYRVSGAESGHYHTASVVIEQDAPVSGRREDGTRKISDDRVSRDDPRWPAVCECGEPFAESDSWQCNELDWYQGPDGQRFVWGIGTWDGPPGAMIRAQWRDQAGRPPAWVIFLPNGTYWCTNDRAVSPEPNGPFWTVTGEAPNLTVAPSINDTNPARPWHGWIRNGVLEPA